MKKLKSELKNEEMALVLLKKLKQSQTVSRETVVTGGATLTPANLGKNSVKGDKQFNNKTSDSLSKEKLVSDCNSLWSVKGVGRFVRCVEVG